MDAFEITQRIRPLMERTEKIRWTGTSSRTAFLPGQIAVIGFGLFFAFGSSWTTARALIRGDVGSISPFSAIFMAVSAAMLFFIFRNVLRDMDVSWAITDRHAYRVSGRRIVVTDLKHAVSVETRQRSGRRGDVSITLPQIRELDGETRQQSVLMLDVEDLHAAHGAVRAAMNPEP